MAKRKRVKEEAGVLVETGGFSVDSRRAVDILLKRQLGAVAETAPLIWVRLAVLSGATRATLLWDSGRFEARFDGNPLPRELLARPYDVYLGSLKGSEAARQFGLGLLHLAREGVGVDISSGPQGQRYAVSLFGPGADPPVESAEPRSDTVVGAVWGGLPHVPPGHPQGWYLPGLVHRLVATPIPLTLSHRGNVEVVVPWRARYGRRGWSGTVDRLRCGVRVIPDPGGEPTAHFSCYGVGVDVEPPWRLPLGVEAWVEHPDLTLSVSLSSLVEDGACERARLAMKSAVATAFDEAMSRHRSRMRLAAAALRRDGNLQRRWKKASQAGYADAYTPGRERVRATAGVFAGPSGDAALVDDVALWNSAWREALLSASRERRRDPASAALVAKLRALPLLFGRGFKPLSIHDGHRPDAFLDRADADFYRSVRA